MLARRLNAIHQAIPPLLHCLNCPALMAHLTHALMHTAVPQGHQLTAPSPHAWMCACSYQESTSEHGAAKLLQTLNTGSSELTDPEIVSPSSLSSAAASAHLATAAVLPSTSATASPPAAAASEEQQQPRPGKSCWSCGATGVPLKKCSVCDVAVYCGAGCQKADWKAQKGQCAGLKMEAASQHSRWGGNLAARPLNHLASKQEVAISIHGGKILRCQSRMLAGCLNAFHQAIPPLCIVRR